MDLDWVIERKETVGLGLGLGLGVGVGFWAKPISVFVGELWSKKHHLIVGKYSRDYQCDFDWLVLVGKNSAWYYWIGTCYLPSSSILIVSSYINNLNR